MTRRHGHTLLEVLIAAALVTLVLGAVYAGLYSGSRAFAASVERLRGPDAAAMLMDRLEQDLYQCIQAPGDPRPPLRVTETKAGPRLTFFAVDVGRTNPNVVVASPVSWELIETAEGSGRYHPMRNGELYDGITLGRWDLELLEPSLEPGSESPGWYLRMVVPFPGEGLLARDYVVRRLAPLHQPTSNFLWFPTHGGEVIEDVVKMLRRPADDPGFEGLGPPDVLDLEPPPAPPEGGAP